MEERTISLPPISQWIEDQLRKQSSLRRSGSETYVTSLTGCPLAWILKRSGVQADTMSPRGTETLEAGNEREVRTLQVLARAGHPLLGEGDLPLLGVPSDKQERVLVKVGKAPYEIQVSGRLDGAVYWEGERVPVEIKTFNSKGWSKFLKEGPPRRYRIQTMLYLRALGGTKCCVLGQNRDTEERAERWVFLDQKLLKELDDTTAAALKAEKNPSEEVLAALGWCSGVETTYYTVKDEANPKKQRPARTGLHEAFQEHGTGWPAGYCDLAYACPTLKRDGYKRVIAKGWAPGWYKYDGDDKNETLKANSPSRRKEVPDAFK